ncbi:MAG: hypothetical protein GY953_50415, partial [bacterium]|nr:hypothetical protein [bacterium]
MSKNDEGEFELVLGNKQLLSVFFIVVVLLGVFFTMGYIVGRNTSDQTQMASTPSKPLVVEAGAVPGSTSVPAPKAIPKPPTTASKPKPRVVERASAAAAAKPPPPAPKPSRVRKPPPVRSQPTPAATGQPASGEVYLQVVATSRPEGGVVLDVLKKRGF